MSQQARKPWQSTALVLLLYVTCQIGYATNPPDQLTIYREPWPATTLTLRWNQPAAGTYTYRVYHNSALASLSATGPALTTFTSAAPSPSTTVATVPGTAGFYLVTADDGSTGESLAIDTVGYTQVTALPGAYATFGLPFRTWNVSGGTPQYGTPSTSPSDLFADQLNCASIVFADRIIDMNNGQFAFRSTGTGCAWSGVLESGAGMILGHGFWYYNRTTVTRTVIVCGQVSRGTPYYTATLLAGAPASPTQTPYAWKEPKVVPINQLELLTQGFQGGIQLTDIADSDIVLSLGPVGLGDMAYYTNAGGWGGGLTQIVPGQVYRIINKHGSRSYNYQYSGTP